MIQEENILLSMVLFEINGYCFDTSKKNSSKIQFEIRRFVLRSSTSSTKYEVVQTREAYRRVIKIILCTINVSNSKVKITNLKIRMGSLLP